jgi:hypothetical protein
MNIYISHSVGCSGWDMPSIYEGTSFKLGCRTLRFNPEENIQMLDWDFKEYQKDPEKVKRKHLHIVKEYDIETIMSMDLWEHNIKEALNFTDKLLKYGNRVLIPVHFYSEELKEYELAYPNANWFAQNNFPPFEYRLKITHILGGSPHKQINHLTTDQVDLFGKPLRFPNVLSIDGNQIFNVAVRVGKIWKPIKPYWRKPKKSLTNEEIFKKSIHNFDKVIKEIAE